MFKLYPKLAVHNLKSSYRLTVPYLLSGSGIIMMYYMLTALHRRYFLFTPTASL